MGACATAGNAFFVTEAMRALIERQLLELKAGQWALSASAQVYASMGDKEVKAKADYMVAELAKCQQKLGASGYLSAFPIEWFDRHAARLEETRLPKGQEARNRHAEVIRIAVGKTTGDPDIQY